MERARAQESHGRMDLATEEWQQVLLTDPGNTEALGGLARAAAAQGNGAFAKIYLDRLKKVDPRNPQIAVVQRLMAEHPGPQAAGDGNDTAATTAPAQLDSPEDLAFRALRRKRVDEAERRFRAILKAEPGSARALLGMGRVRILQHNYLAAITFLEQARERNPESRQVRLYLDQARFWFDVEEGHRFLLGSDTATAEQRYRAALQIRPESGHALDGLGNTLLKEGKPAAALPVFERAAAREPERAGAWAGQVAALYEGGHVSEALTLDRRIPASVREELAKDPAYLQTLASALWALGRSADAQSTLGSAVKLASDPAQAQLKAALQIQLAGVLLAERHPVDAATLYREATAARPGDTAAWQGIVTAEFAAGDTGKALQDFNAMPSGVRERSIRENDDLVTALGTALDTAGRAAEAKDLLDKAVKERQSSARGIPTSMSLALASAELALGHAGVAVPIYQQVTGKDPNLPEAWSGLFYALHATGQDSELLARLPLVPAGVRGVLESDQRYLDTMAEVYAHSGEARQATRYLSREEQNYAAQGAKPPIDIEIQNAAMLYHAADDAGLYRELTALGLRPDLTDAQRDEVQGIWTDWALRRASQAIAAGDRARGVAVLNAAAQAFPANTGAMREVAKALTDAGEPQKAVSIYEAQGMKGATEADFQNALTAALDAADRKAAETWVHAGLQAYPSDPKMLVLAARLEQQRGDANRAMEYYRELLKAMPAGSAKAGSTLAATTAGSQSLADLLAPAGSASVSLEQPGAATPEASGAQASGASLAISKAGVSTSPGVSGTVQHGSSFPPASNQPNPTVSYIAPPPPKPVLPGAKDASGAVSVQFGNNTPPPVQKETEMTDVLPTARYGPNARASEDPDAAAAQADRIRRLRQDSTAPTGTSSQAAALIPQPATMPAKSASAVPDTGAQQYPQPRTQPHSARARPQTPAAPSIVETGPTGAPVPSPGVKSESASTPVPDVQPTIPVTPPATDAELAARGGAAFSGGVLNPQVPIGGSPRAQAENALASLEGSYSGWVGASGIGRYRSGTPGVDRLYDLEVPLEASAVIGRAVRVTAVAVPVSLSSGQFGGSLQTTSVPYLGTMPTSTAVAPAQQSSSGVGGELEVASKYAGVAGGYTPSGFLMRNYTGRAYLSVPRHQVTFFGERQPVRDTQLSYAGLRDPGVSASTGPVWGGVMSTDGGVQVGSVSDTSAAGIYLMARGGVLTGRHVQDNTRILGQAGAFFRVHTWGTAGTLSIAGEFSGMHYAHNEAGLSYGHGGYFSPSSYLRGAAPLRFSGGHGDRLHYTIEGSLGLRTFQQDAALIYPLDPGLQRSLLACGSGAVSYACGVSPYKVTTDFDYSSRAQAAYRVGQHWYAGGYFNANNANDFNEVSAGFFFRYTFGPQATSEGRPTGLFPLTGIRPLQIP